MTKQVAGVRSGNGGFAHKPVHPLNGAFAGIHQNKPELHRPERKTELLKSEYQRPESKNLESKTPEFLKAELKKAESKTPDLQQSAVSQNQSDLHTQKQKAVEQWHKCSLHPASLAKSISLATITSSTALIIPGSPSSSDLAL